MLMYMDTWKHKTCNGNTDKWRKSIQILMQTKPLGHNKYGTNKYHITHTHYKNYLGIFSDEEGN